MYLNSTLLKVKFLLILLTTSFIDVKAYHFNQKVSLRAKHIQLASVLKEIQKQSGYNIFYSDDIVPNTLLVSVNAKNENVENILKKILPQLELEFKSIENNIILNKKKIEKNPRNHAEDIIQQRTIKGKVTNENNEILAGVTISVKGSTDKAFTSNEGTFELKVNSNATLEFKLLGYEEKIVVVNQNTVYDVVMRPKVDVMDEVVVVGYGQQKKVNLTGAVSSINFEKEAESRPLTSISNALAGLAPGLQAMQSSGMPNSDNANIRIRGTGTLNSSSPLVLVDGMEQSFTDINPADVESISILKDAASASIYGNRAANGVILITTKRGKQGKIDVSYRSLYSFNQPSNLIKLEDNSANYMELMNESSVNVGQSPIFTQETIDLWRKAEKDPNGISENGYPNYVAYPNTDWYKAVFQNKMMNDQTISARGATEKANYSLSGTYLNNPGLINGAGLKKYYLRSNISINVNDWLTVGNRTYGYQNDLGRNSTSGTLSGIGFTKIVPSTYPFYNGQYGAPGPKEEDPQSHNTLWNIESTGGSYTSSQINTSLFADLKLFKDIVYHVNFDWTRFWREDRFNNKSLGKYSFTQDQMIIAPMTPQEMSSTFYTAGDKRSRLEQTLTYNKTIQDIHDFNVLLGYEEIWKRTYWVDAQKTGLIDETLTDLSTATIMTGITGINSEFSARSFFGRLNYAFDSRYLIEVNMRYDGSSRFSPETRWGLFPSVSAGWRISQESFFKDIEAINELKLRMSWGKLGNNSIGNYDWQDTYSTNYYSFGNALNTGLAMTSIANRGLQWESTTISNIGIDIAFLQNKLNAVVDLYDKTTSGILFRPNIYATMGNKTAPFENIAVVKNKGIEIGLTWMDRKGDFGYNISTNFAYNHNRVTKYKGALERGWTTDATGNDTYFTNIGDVSTGGTNRILEGNMINEFYTLNVYKGNGKYFNSDGAVDIKGGPKDGMIRTEDDMKWLEAMRTAGYAFYPNQSISKNNIWYGDYIYDDFNGDGVYGNSADNDFRNLSTQPKYNLGFQAGFTYKNFDLSMSWAASLDFGIYWYTVGQNSSSTIFGYAIPKSIANDHYFYDPNNPNDPRTNLTSKNPRITRNGGSSQNEAISNLHLERGDFLKLKNLTLGYTWKNPLGKIVNIRDIRFFMSGENLLNINKFKGMDPEMQTGMGYVTMRQLALGLNINF